MNSWCRLGPKLSLPISLDVIVSAQFSQLCLLVKYCIVSKFVILPEFCNSFVFRDFEVSSPML